MVRIEGSSAEKVLGTPSAPKSRRMERLESPQIEVRLRKGIARSVAEEQLSVFRSVLVSSASSIKNWRSLQAQDLSSVSHIASNIFVGSLSFDDGELIEEDWSSVETSSLHFYRPNEDGALSQELSLDDSTAVAAVHWQLPSLDFEGIWENLIFEDNTKNELMSYVYALIRFSEKYVNPKVVNMHRLVLLVGPPGTGKTSLCKGLAHHLSIRLSSRYPRCIFVEVNSHSLFSKWFSESGKLVQKMFDDIEELASDPKTFVFVLIDEAESLCMSREKASARNEPTDSVRAVNAVLTQIDRIQRLVSSMISHFVRLTNVLVLATSNLTTIIDSALVDRADFVKHIGRPSLPAIRSILNSCLIELQRVGLVEEGLVEEHAMNPLCSMAQGLSARALRQVPILAYAKLPVERLSVPDFLETLRISIEDKLSSQR